MALSGIGPSSAGTGSYSLRYWLLLSQVLALTLSGIYSYSLCCWLLPSLVLALTLSGTGLYPFTQQVLFGCMPFLHFKDKVFCFLKVSVYKEKKGLTLLSLNEEDCTEDNSSQERMIQVNYKY